MELGADRQTYLRKLVSTYISHAPLHFNDMLTAVFENNHFVSGTFLDLSKAFDTL